MAGFGIGSDDSITHKTINRTDSHAKTLADQASLVEIDNRNSQAGKIQLSGKSNLTINQGVGADAFTAGLAGLAATITGQRDVGHDITNAAADRVVTQIDDGAKAATEEAKPGMSRGTVLILMFALLALVALPVVAFLKKRKKP